MYVRNTSTHPTPLVKSLVKWATSEIDMRKVCVNVKGSKSAFAGMAYDGVPTISNAPPSSDYLITVRIGTADRFPFEQHRYPGKSDRFPTYDLRDWREALVYVSAHEACHIEQYRERLRRSELRCEHYAVGVLEAFRTMLEMAH